MCKCGLMCKCENVQMLGLGYKGIKPFTHLHVVSVSELEKVVSREQSLVGGSKLCC